MAPEADFTLKKNGGQHARRLRELAAQLEDLSLGIPLKPWRLPHSGFV
jgi:hypothetical protein